MIDDVLCYVYSGRLEGSNPHSVFRTNLEQVMIIQKENYPTLDYPAIVKVLIESIKVCYMLHNIILHPDVCANKCACTYRWDIGSAWLSSRRYLPYISGKDRA
jgi:hypothetical protein